MIGDFLNKLEKVRGKRGHWVACCPAHEDKRPSLAITETDDGRILLKCFAGCSAYEVVSAVGMDLTDLFPKDQSFMPSDTNKPVRRPRRLIWLRVGRYQTVIKNGLKRLLRELTKQ